MLQPLLCCYFCAILSQLRHEVASYLLQKGYLLVNLIFPCELLDAFSGVFQLIFLLFGVQVLRVHFQLRKVVVHIDLLLFLILAVLLVNGPELSSLPKQRNQLPLINPLPFLEVVDDLMRSVLVNERQGFYLLGKEYLKRAPEVKLCDIGYEIAMLLVFRYKLLLIFKLMKKDAFGPDGAD